MKIYKVNIYGEEEPVDLICYEFKNQEEVLSVWPIYPFKNIKKCIDLGYENGGAYWFSSDYKYYAIWFYDGDKGESSSIKREQIISIRDITREDMIQHNRELWKFYKSLNIDPSKGNISWLGFDDLEQMNMFE